MPIIWQGEAYDFPADPESGATTVRLTSSLYHHINIYYDRGFSSPDGRRVAILRSPNCDPRLPPSDLLVADLYNLQLAVLERDITSIVVATAAWSGWIYYLNNNRELMRANLSTLEKEVVWTRWPFDPDFIFHTVSSDLRFMVGQMMQRNYKTVLVRIDLVEKDWKVIYEDYEISNPHPVYSPSGHDLSVFKIGGFAVNDRQEVMNLETPRTNTYFIIDHEGQNYRPLPFGRPRFPEIGHISWIGDTGKIVNASLLEWTGNRASHRPECQAGNIFYAGPDDSEPIQFTIPEYHFNHVAATRCGRYFVAESYSVLPGAVPLVVGCFETGKYRVLLSDSKASGGAAAIGHAHAYFTSDNKHVIYNADPTWVGHVWAARIPDGFLENLN
jgi:hypothetical protein